MKTVKKIFFTILVVGIFLTVLGYYMDIIDRKVEDNYFKHRIAILESNNKRAKENLDNLYYFFDKFKHYDPITFNVNWKLAQILKYRSSELIGNIDTLKQSIVNGIPILSPFEVFLRLDDFKSGIDTLIDTTKMISLSLNNIRLVKLGPENTSWDENIESDILSLTIIENAVINDETAILMRLYHDMKKKDEELRQLEY